MKITEFTRALRDMDRSEEVAHAVMETTFPLGAVVYYKHGNYRREGVVERFGYGLDLQITSPRGKTIWIDARGVTGVRP